MAATDHLRHGARVGLFYTEAVSQGLRAVSAVRPSMPLVTRNRERCALNNVSFWLRGSASRAREGAP
jgi:hypothetical protein